PGGRQDLQEDGRRHRPDGAVRRGPSMGRKLGHCRWIIRRLDECRGTLVRLAERGTPVCDGSSHEQDIASTADDGSGAMSVMRWGVIACLALLMVGMAAPVHAYKLAISQYGRVTATLPWVIAMEKGYFADEGVKIDQIIAGMGGGTTLRNMLASDLPYGEVATSAAIAAIRSGIDLVIVNTASSHIGEIALVANPKSSIHKIQDLAG